MKFKYLLSFCLHVSVVYVFLSTRRQKRGPDRSSQQLQQTKPSRIEPNSMWIFECVYFASKPKAEAKLKYQRGSINWAHLKMFVKQFNDFPNSFNSLKMRFGFVLFRLHTHISIYLLLYFVFVGLWMLLLLRLLLQFFLLSASLYARSPTITSNHIKCVKWKSFNLTMRERLKQTHWSHFEWEVTNKRWSQPYLLCLNMNAYRHTKHRASPIMCSMF